MEVIVSLVVSNTNETNTCNEALDSENKLLYTLLCTANSDILSQIIPIKCFHSFLNTLTWSKWTLFSRLKYINYFIN